MTSQESSKTAESLREAAENADGETEPENGAAENETAPEEKQSVNWHGTEMELVPGTGQSDDLTGAVLDYGDNRWWVEEGFVGQYLMNEDTEQLAGVTEEYSELTVYENGAVVWITDDAVYSGELFDKRHYGDAAHGYVTADDDQVPRAFEIDFVRTENGTAEYYGPEEKVTSDIVRIFCAEQTEPDPLDEICVYLQKTED